MRRVLVLGGGFGGIAAATALRARLGDSDEVVLVERQPTFVMGLRKNWGLVGSSTIVAGERQLASLARRGIDVVAGTIDEIRPAAREARVAGRTISADALVVALGAERDPDRIPGFREHAIDVYDRDANAVGAAAIEAFAGGRVVVGIFGAPYPCPPAPYELALLLTERLAERRVPGGVFVFSPQAGSLPVLGEAGCAAFDGRLANEGISFRAKTVATAVEAGAVVAADTRIPFDMLLGVPPHRVPPVVVTAGLAEAGGWVRVDPRTLETRFPGVFAIGDVTAIPIGTNQALPKAGVFAQAQGEVVAARVADRLAGREPEARFEGEGLCFLETGRGMASAVQGRFLAEPPEVELTPATAAGFEAKRAFESDRLAAWFGY